MINNVKPPMKMKMREFMHLRSLSNISEIDRNVVMRTLENSNGAKIDMRLKILKGFLKSDPPRYVSIDKTPTTMDGVIDTLNIYMPPNSRNYMRGHRYDFNSKLKRSTNIHIEYGSPNPITRPSSVADIRLIVRKLP